MDKITFQMARMCYHEGNKKTIEGEVFMDRIYVDLTYAKNPVDKKIFGHFCEHGFANIYG